MDIKFVIPGELPAMNEIIKASKSHYGAYAKLKKDYTALVMIHAKGLPEVKKADFEITWYCKNKRKDPDNVAGGGTKILLDGLIKAGIIPNDGWNEVNSITHDFKVDKDNPRIEVEIREI